MVELTNQFVLVGSSKPSRMDVKNQPSHPDRLMSKILESPRRTDGASITQRRDVSGQSEEISMTLSTYAKNYADTLFKTYVTGDMDLTQAKLILTNLKDEVTKLAFVLVGKDGKLIDSATTLLKASDVTSDPSIEAQLQTLPRSGDAFTLHNPSNGRSRLIPSFQDQLSGKIAAGINSHLQAFSHDHDPKHIQAISSIAHFASDARSLYVSFSERHSEETTQLLEHLKQLGLTKNLTTEGEGSKLILALVKSDQFGRMTPEDRGRKGKLAPKNQLVTGENPSLSPLSTLLRDATGKPIDPIQSQGLLELVKSLTTDQKLHELRAEYDGFPEIQELVDWTARETIVRQFLPQEATVQKREIDMSTLHRIKSLGKEDSSDPNFQASNPISLWVDQEANRKYIVKHCPEQTLQSDYFGLEMLQLSGIPIYEFYYGYIPTENGGTDRVLVSGFLEGFTDPSALITLPENAPKGKAKTLLPEYLKASPYIQRAMLVEILIGEYNSKAHNFMALGDSVQHLDQGASLTSTASGKFKGFSEEVTIQDVADVLRSWTDWDPNASEAVNEAYARVADVIDGKLVINDTSMAQTLLDRMKRIPQERIDEALVQAGYTDGPESVARMQTWIKQIDQVFLPRYQDMPDSDRKKQYLRWSESAKETFQKAISMGGELTYYKNALRTRRTSLETLWQEAIDLTRKSTSSL